MEANRSAYACTMADYCRGYAEAAAAASGAAHGDGEKATSTTQAGVVPLFPPPVEEEALDSRRGLPSTWSTPFLTTLAGALPHGPAPLDVDEVCGTYLVSGASKLPPNVDVDFETVMLDSNGAALATTLNLTRSP